jgi:HPt (histidine-containing phosphotransfer) domain-containing protein
MDALEKLKIEYVNSLPIKKSTIFIMVDSVIRSISTDDPNPNWNDLQKLAHQYRGSLSTYEFENLAKLMKELEEKIESGELTSKDKNEIIFYLNSWKKIVEQEFTKVINENANLLKTGT